MNRRLRAILRGACPRCFEGAIFGGWLAMNDRCPRCRLAFEREPGYFVGAMYLSYALSVPLLAGLTLGVLWLRPGWDLSTALLAAVALCLPLAPLLFRFARVAWLHIDHLLDRPAGP